MKKVFAMLLALVMVLSMSTVAMAVGSTSPSGAGAISGGNTGEVTVAVTGVAADTHIYYVVINWNGGLNFTYDFAESEKRWNPEEHEFDISADGAGWNRTTASITITNHSSKAITASAKFDNDSTTKIVNGVTATVSASANVAAPSIGSDFNSAPTGTLTVSISNDEPTVKTGFNIGTVTVTIS